MIQQKSENSIVPEDLRKGVTTRGEIPQKGGKAVPAKEEWMQLELPFAIADSHEKEWVNDRIAEDRSPARLIETPNAAGSEENAPPATMETLITQLRPAFKKVASNKGAPGPDKQTIEEVESNLGNILEDLSSRLLEGRYKPGESRRVQIPKVNGGTRDLSIPNVLDRIVQEALRRTIEPLYEPRFHPSSHGFRPGRSCHTAISEAVNHLARGNEWVVDLDLEKFFDTVCHHRLLSKLRESIKDQRIVKLIHKMLKAGVVMPDGVVIETKKGVPQGGPLSPLLSNIVLHELDQELTSRGHPFVRYADDCNIYVRSERAGHRVMESITRYIEKRMRLRVNREKSSVSRSGDRHFLGFTLYRDPWEGEVKIRLSKRTRSRVNQRLRELIPRNWGKSIKVCINRLNRYLKGWLGFFRICSEEMSFKWIDSHIRRRIRNLTLKQWKRKRTIARKLIHLGVSRRQAWKRVYMGKRRAWSLSIDWAVHKGLSSSYLADLGLTSLVQMWKEKRILTASPNQWGM